MTHISQRQSLLFPLLAVAAVSGGCASGYAEMEEDQPLAADSYAAQGQENSPPVLRYDIPADAPQGQAYVMSLGVESLGPPGGQPEQLLHLRIAVENDSSQPWIVDPEQAMLTFDNMAPMPAKYAKGPQPPGPQTIAAGTRGQVDLYFAMPPNTRPQTATLMWQLRRGGETIATNSRFDLVTGSQANQIYYQPIYDPALVYAWGPGWWWGPDWYWGFGWWWGAPWWWGGWGWGPGFRHPWGWGHFHRGWGRPGGGMYRGYHGGFAPRGGIYRGGGFAPGGTYRGGGFAPRGGSFGGGGFRGGGGFHGGGFHGGGGRGR